MANNTAEYWDLDGVSLHQYGWSIQTLGGSRFGVPPLRGEDRQYAYVPGQAFQPKIPDSRVLTLGMWVTGADPATGIPGTDQRTRWNDSFHQLRSLMWKPRRQVILTRRWMLTDPDTGIPTLVTASAEAQYVNGLEPDMTGRTRATFTVDFKLSDPFFYGAEQTQQINVGDTETIYNPGDYDASHRHLYVDLVGPLTRPVLTNTTPDPQVSVTYNSAISSGTTVTLDMAEFTAMNSSEVSTPETALNLIRWVSHSGAHHWMGLLASSDNALTLTADAGSGHAVVRFRAPYI